MIGGVGYGPRFNAGKSRQAVETRLGRLIDREVLEN